MSEQNVCVELMYVWLPFFMQNPGKLFDLVPELLQQMWKTYLIHLPPPPPPLSPTQDHLC